MASGAVLPGRLLAADWVNDYTLIKGRSFLYLVKVNEEVNQAIGQSQGTIPWLTLWLTLTRCRKDRALINNDDG